LGWFNSGNAPGGVTGVTGAGEHLDPSSTIPAKLASNAKDKRFISAGIIAEISLG
jgi:hypothetical protein